VDQILAGEQLTSLTQPGSVLLPLTNNVGTVCDLAQYNPQSGTTSVVDHRVYDSFGNLKSQTNAAVDFLFGFTGRPLDQATGLQNNLNRWYDSGTGRWMSKDPTGFFAGDTNTECYCGNNSTSEIDPTGLEERWGWGGSLAGTAYAGVAGIGRIFTYPFRLIPGTSDFWAERDKCLNDLYDACNIGGTKWETMSKAGSAGAAVGIAVVIVLPAAPVAATLGIGSQAVVSPGLGAGVWPALLVNGTVYVARFHQVAWEMANHGEVQKYGMVIIDAAGKVIGWR
jgi:RHS repeat-associated protein